MHSSHLSYTSIGKLATCNKHSVSNLLRFVSTLNTPSSEEPFHHKEWPRQRNPTPYQVLNVDPKADIKELRKKYYAIAKIYHPDISLKKKHIGHDGKHLSNDLKEERFKLLTEAYKLLKDRKKKALYDQYKVGWGKHSVLLDDAFSSQRPFHGTSRTHQRNFNDHAYWYASNWEDYENLNKNFKPLSKEEKVKVILGILFIMITSGMVQGWWIFESVEKRILTNKKITEDCEFDLSMAYSNYGLDDSRIARIRRFLWFRTFGLYYDKEGLDRGAKEDDRIMNEVMGDTR